MKISSLPPSVGHMQRAELSNIRSLVDKPEPQAAMSSVKQPFYQSAAEKLDSGTYSRPSMVDASFGNYVSPVDGDAVRGVAKQLNSASTRYSNGASLVASGFMESLADLAKATPRFEGEQRVVSMSEEAALAGVRPDFADKLHNRDDVMKVQIRTKEGDLVSVELSTATGENGEKGVSFSMSVDGDLSSDELEAVAEMAQGLGRLADRFFDDGEAALNELAGLDSKFLAGFDLKLTDANSETLMLNQSVSELEGAARLKGEFQGYSFDVTRDAAHSMVGDNLLENPQYQQYLQLIEQAGRDFDTDGDVVRFMKDGLGAVFGLEATEQERQTLKIDHGKSVGSYLNGQVSSELKNFHSNLPDFEASFDSPVTVNPHNVVDKAFMSLNMSQQSELTRSEGGQVRLAQKLDYQQNVQTFEALPGMSEPDLEAGNYVLQKQDRDEQVLRTLELDNGRVVTAAESLEGAESTVSEHKKDFELVEINSEKDDYDDVIDLLAESKALGKDAAESVRDDMLNSDSLKMFEYSGASKAKALQLEEERQ